MATPGCTWCCCGTPSSPQGHCPHQGPVGGQGDPRVEAGTHSLPPSLGARGLLQPAGAHAPDLTTAQMIRMFWGGLSLAATPGSCTSTSGNIPISDSGRFHNPDFQTLGPTGTAALLSFLGGRKLSYNSAVSSLAKARGTACPDPTEPAPRLSGVTPGLGPLPSPARLWHIQSHHPDAIAVLTLAPESIKDSRKVQSSSWAWQHQKRCEEGGKDPKNTSPGLHRTLFRDSI